MNPFALDPYSVGHMQGFCMRLLYTNLDQTMEAFVTSLSPRFLHLQLYYINVVIMDNSMVIINS